VGLVLSGFGFAALVLVGATATVFFDDQPKLGPHLSFNALLASNALLICIAGMLITSIIPPMFDLWERRTIGTAWVTARLRSCGTAFLAPFLIPRGARCCTA